MPHIVWEVIRLQVKATYLHDTTLSANICAKSSKDVSGLSGSY